MNIVPHVHDCFLKMVKKGRLRRCLPGPSAPVERQGTQFVLDVSIKFYEIKQIIFSLLIVIELGMIDQERLFLYDKNLFSR